MLADSPSEPRSSASPHCAVLSAALVAMILAVLLPERWQEYSPIGALRRESVDGLLNACYQALLRHMSPDIGHLPGPSDDDRDGGDRGVM